MNFPGSASRVAFSAITISRNGYEKLVVEWKVPSTLVMTRNESTRHDTTQYDSTGHGTTRHDWAQHDTTRPGTTRRNVAQRGNQNCSLTRPWISPNLGSIEIISSCRSEQNQCLQALNIISMKDSGALRFSAQKCVYKSITCT